MESIPLAQPFSFKTKDVNEEMTPVGKGLPLDVSKDESLDDLSTPSPQLELKGKKAIETPDTTTETSLSLQAREAEEHALVAAAKQREVEKHHAELISLRKQAEELEQQSKALLDEAEEERAKVKLALEVAERAEKQEQKGYASAESVEKERREAAHIALPKLENAADAEVYAQEVTQQAEDHEFHAQILENRAKALVQESEQMSELASEKQQEANEVASKIDAAVKELEDLELKADDGKPGDLPEYVMECEREVGMLQRRLAQLTEEIAWSKREIERRRKDGELWDRLLTKRRAALADLKMEHYSIEQAIVDAKERANIAAQEATMPAGLAEEKFSLAAELRKQATEATNKALEIQRDAIEAARRAMEIQKQRELAMADAAKAEAEARQAEKDAATIQAAIAEREITANQKMQDAASLKRKAEDTMAMKDEINKIHALSQLHPMYFTGEELIETAPPAPKTPASTSLST